MGEAVTLLSEDFDPQAPATPTYRYMQSLRYPLTLPTPARLFHDATVQAGTIPRAGGEIPCVIIAPPRLSPPPPILVYYPGGWCVGKAEDCEFIREEYASFRRLAPNGVIYDAAFMPS